MNTYVSQVAVVSIQSLRKQWHGTGPVVPDSIQPRKEYATHILRELGHDVAYVVLTGFDEMSKDAIGMLMTRGVDMAGKTMRVAFITQRKGTSAPLPLVDEPLAALTAQMFPRVVDTVRMGALLTPMRGGVAVRVPARVLITTPDDARFQLGDGQGMVAADWMPGHLPVRYKHQFRAVLHALHNGVDMLAKGTLLSGTDAQLCGYDIVLTKNEVKGGDGSLPLGEHTIEVTIGCMHGQDERLSGPTTFGRQFMQHMPPAFFDSPAMDAHVRRVAATLHKVAENPLQLARFLVLHQGNGRIVPVMRDIRNDAGDVERGALLGFAAAISGALGSNKLLYTQLIRELLTNALADKCRNLAVSGGMAARYYMLTADNRLPVGTIKINAGVLASKHYGEVEVVAGRNPHVEAKGAVAVTLVGDPDVHPDYAVANELTLIDAAADNDGDQVLIGIGGTPQMAMWREWLLAIDRSNVDKVRRKGEPPATKAEMIAQVMSIQIGVIERTLAMVVAAEQIHGKSLTAYYDGRLAVIEARDAKTILADQLQRAVDGIKTGSMPNMKLVRLIGQFAGQLLDEDQRDIGYIPLDNGTLPVFRRAPEELSYRQDKLGLEPGEYVVPSNYVSTRTPLGRHMRKVEDLVPQVSFDVVPNAEFVGWLPLIPGEGAMAALASCRRFNADLAEAHRQPADLVDESVSEVIRAFREEWRKHYAEKDPAWLRSAASQIWQVWCATESKGYILWHSLPEVWATMLLERKAEIAAMPSLKVGKIIGGDFRAVLAGEKEAWFDVTVYLRAGKKRIKVHHEGGIADNLLDEKSSADVGKYRALVRDVGNRGSFPALFHEAGYELPVVRMPAKAEAPEAEAAPAAEMDEDEEAAAAFFDPSEYLDDGVVFEA